MQESTLLRLRYVAVVNGGDVRVRDVARLIHESSSEPGQSVER